MLRHKKYTIEEVKKLADERNGKCLSEIYINNCSTLLWYCNKCKKEWETSFKIGRAHV